MKKTMVYSILTTILADRQIYQLNHENMFPSVMLIWNISVPPQVIFLTVAANILLLKKLPVMICFKKWRFLNWVRILLAGYKDTSKWKLILKYIRIYNISTPRYSRSSITILMHTWYDNSPISILEILRHTRMYY